MNHLLVDVSLYIFLLQGISLRRETDGSISVIRLDDTEVIVKGYQNPANHCLSADIVSNHGRVPNSRSIKVSITSLFKKIYKRFQMVNFAICQNLIAVHAWQKNDLRHL